MTPRYRTAFFAPSGFATSTAAVQTVAAAAEVKHRGEAIAAGRSRGDARRSHVKGANEAA